MSVFIVRDLDLLHNLIKEIAQSIWDGVDVSDYIDIGPQKRVSITLNGVTEMLDIYQKSDGLTTFNTVGKKTDLSSRLKKELEIIAYQDTSEVKSYTINIGEVWTERLVSFLSDLVLKNKGTYDVSENNGNTIHAFRSIIGDKLTLTDCSGGKMLVQGKALYLYNEMISFLSHSPEVRTDEIIAVTRAFVNERIQGAETVREKLFALAPNAYGSGKIDDAIWKILSPSIVLAESNSVLEDYSCVCFPALRALEGYMCFLFDEIGVKINLSDNKAHKFFCEKNDYPGEFVLSTNKLCTDAFVDSSYSKALETVYSFFYTQRHSLFHMNQVSLCTRFVEKKQEAIDIVYGVVRIIEETYSSTHL